MLAATGLAIDARIAWADPYVTPYTITFTQPNLDYDFSQSPRNDHTLESSLPHARWYDQSDSYYQQGKMSKCDSSLYANVSFGPPPAQYPKVEVPAGVTDPVAWKRERIIKTALRYLGYHYQHHYVPNFDPAASDNWPHSCPSIHSSELTKGMSCSTFSAWNYNFGLGIRLHVDAGIQGKMVRAPGPGGIGEIRAQVIRRADYPSFNDWVAALRTGDILYLAAANDEPSVVTAELAHAATWVGPIGSGPDPLVIDSHDNDLSDGGAFKDVNGDDIPTGVQLRPVRENEWYYRKFSHALRFIY